MYFGVGLGDLNLVRPLTATVLSLMQAATAITRSSCPSTHRTSRSTCKVGLVSEICQSKRLVSLRWWEFCKQWVGFGSGSQRGSRSDLRVRDSTLPVR